MAREYYLLRARGRNLQMREGNTLADPVYPITNAAPTPFKVLPFGVPRRGNDEVDVEVVDKATYDKTPKPKTIKELKAERIAAGRLTPSERDALRAKEAIAARRAARGRSRRPASLSGTVEG